MGTKETRTVTISVILPNGTERETEITIRGIDPKHFITGSATREGRLRGIINNFANDDSTQKVMIDLYRNLVLGNFTKLNGKRGKAAKADLDKLYPEQGALPEFELQPMPNASGVIVHNILKRQDAEGENYCILGGILVQLLSAGFLDKPKLQV